MAARPTLALSLAACLAVPALAQQPLLAVGGDALVQGFESPPASAEPRVWWHWMNGNVTKEGIKLDLEWMHRSHIAGFQNFDAALFTPQLVEKRLAYMTPEWKDAFRYATSLANGFGMEEAIAGSPGWSETGGPWVPASQAMKKYVWSETHVDGGKPFTGKLTHPPINTGAFQNLPSEDGSDGDVPMPEFYADSAVVAYKVPATETMAATIKPVISSSGGAISPSDAGLLGDGDLVKPLQVPRAARLGEKTWIQFAYPQPQTIRALTVVIASSRNQLTDFLHIHADGDRALEASDDGQNFHLVLAIPMGGTAEHTLTFAPVTARFFRLTITTPAMPDKLPSEQELKAAGITITSLPTTVAVAEFALHPDARVNRFEEKAAFVPTRDLYAFATPPAIASDVIDKNAVVDLTGKMRPDGTLDWTPPPGQWTVLRVGYSLLGITNHPATKEATGLEVDKLNAAYVKNYMDRYLDSYKETVGPEMMGRQGIRYVITDSWEAGAQNWTDNMVAEFTRRRGYDPHPWLPVLTGRIVGSAEASDQFLWDLRKTIADLTSDEHYGQVEASLKARGMGHYGESHEAGRALIADGMEVKKLDDIPMSAMWTQTPGVNEIRYGFNADDRESASVAHIYGQNLAAAESMTAAEAPWGWSPETLKPTADQEFLNGINRFVIHESAHQPFVDKKPGLTLGPYGQWFNRNETWAEDAHVWIDYLARTSYLLQQGQAVADILYFYGEDSNVTAIFHASAPDTPPGYNFDYVNADALIHAFHTADGKLTAQSGMSYRVLALDPYSRHMSLPVLRAIYGLVQHGAIVAGPKPVGTPSLADDAQEFSRLSDQLFGDGSGVHSVGSGKVYAGQDAGAVLKELNIDPDFTQPASSPDHSLFFVHRRIADGDIYFVDNRSTQAVDIRADFRVTGKEPELWYAETGTMRAAGYSIADGHTSVPLHLEPWGTTFVVFRKPATAMARTLPPSTEKPLQSVDGPWNIAFEAGRGAPASAVLPSLASWSDNADKGIKYFSGTVHYTRTIQAAPAWFKPGTTLWLDLGDVKNLAEVTVNGKSLGVLWHAPFRADVTGALKPGANTIEIRVTNLWVNRLIGDQQPDAATKYTFADVKPYHADSPLLPSGLLGPVTVLQQTR
ncbi:glycoside hydrolase [Acidipila sp. EB88]|nr:glycoside hydrolase [Acidipila sp. EB88]